MEEMSKQEREEKRRLPNSKTPPSPEFMKGGGLESGSFWVGEGITKDWISRKA